MESLKTYWDLEPKTRAALSEADVNRYIDAELMLKGVLKVEPLELEPEPAEPELKKTTFYKLAGFDPVFERAEDAQAFAKLAPLHSDYRYIAGYSDSVEYHRKATSQDLEVVPIELRDEVDVANAKSALDRLGELRKSNESRRQEHSKALKIQNDALDGMWADWYARRSEAREHRKVIETYEAYCKTAGGDTETAAKFLQKVFTVEQIVEAATWFDTSIQTKFFECEALPGPGPSHPDAPPPERASDDIAF